MRPTDVPDTGLLCDLLWADPDKDVNGWAENDRGVSFTFGSDAAAMREALRVAGILAALGGFLINCLESKQRRSGTRRVVANFRQNFG